jgi:hypothetical protein
MDAIKCKTCDTGTLVRRRTYRMSSIVVIIGYIILVPSILGIIIGVATCFGVASKSTGPNDTATGIATGIAFFWTIASLVGGVFGWLLVMKKSVLQCDRCGAIVAAS